jgi:hypothetical protein
MGGLCVGRNQTKILEKHNAKVKGGVNDNDQFLESMCIVMGPPPRWFALGASRWPLSTFTLCPMDEYALWAINSSWNRWMF